MPQKNKTASPIHKSPIKPSQKKNTNKHMKSTPLYWLPRKYKLKLQPDTLPTRPSSKSNHSNNS